MSRERSGEYLAFQSKLLRRGCVNAAVSAAVVVGLYLLVWKQRMGEWMVWFLAAVFPMSRQDAFYFYNDHFRGNRELFFAGAMLLVFTALLWRIFRWVTGYFKEVDRGIEALLAEEAGEIRLSPEMLPFERKLNTVKRTLARRREETALAERRKDELVMYLAHDIRTPLTSVIGYLDLLEEEPEAPAEQRARRVRIALDKAYRLEAMLEELFEITRYNSRQMAVAREEIDLYYMLVQLSDELSPVLAARGNWVTLDLDEELTLWADADKLARVFGNILKNAAAYSDPDTEISISAERGEGEVVIRFQNRGEDIPPESLAVLFDKFYRGDRARRSDTGGTGLGLAIAREIVTLHGGIIQAASGDHRVTFTLRLPAGET